MLSLKISNWLSRFKEKIFIYKDGFYHLPYNGHSPEKMISSVAKYPFVKHNKQLQSIYANTPFSDGGFSYRKLEEGCWLMYSKIRYKTNVAFDLAYDNSSKNKDDDINYYVISITNVTQKACVDEHGYNHDIYINRYSWNFLKPQLVNSDLNFKGGQNRCISIYFNEKWLQDNLAHNSLFLEAKLDEFLASNEPYLVCPLMGDERALDNFEIFEKAMNLDGSNGPVDFLQLKHHSFNFIFEFFKHCIKQQVVGNQVATTYDDKLIMYQLENHLNKNLYDKFPGIDVLAKKFNLSETKLKAEFKLYFGKPIYQYFQERQMLVAKKLLVENKHLIKEISYKLGYESTSKFTAAFKRYHGVLPSDLQK